jgi:hypothetical protein
MKTGQHMKKSILATFFLAMIAGSGHGLGFMVTPPRCELTMVSGQSQTEIINIINQDSTAPLRLKVSVKAWEKDKRGQITYYDPASKARSCGNWLVVNPSEFEIPAGGVETARFTVTVPESVKGSYWGIIFFESQPDTTVKITVGVRLVGRVGVSVYVNVDGTLQFQSEMTGLTYKRGGYKRHEFTVGIKNDGNAFFRPKGALEIKDAAGKKINTTPIPDDQIVLPGAQSDMKIIINEVIPPGRYTATINLDSGLPELLEGEVGFEVVP